MTLKSLCNSPSEYYPALEETYIPSLHAYQEYIRELCFRNPSLSTLSKVLSSPNAQRSGSRCRATVLEFRTGTAHPCIRPVTDISCMRSEFYRTTEKDLEKPSENTKHQAHGRIIIIEDLTVEVITLLGTELDLDPLFLATHLHTVHRTGMRYQTPDDATLPSRLHQSDYINVSYHQPVTCEDAFPSGAKFTANTTINRKLVFLRATNIGLAQHRASIIKIQQEDGFWLALILVDPPLGNTFYRGGGHSETGQQVKLHLEPYLGAYEDFMEAPSFSQSCKPLRRQERGGMMSDLIRYWDRTSPRCFDPVDPSIQSLAYYPLRIVAAQWVKYIAVMLHCIKLYEYEGNHLDLEKFNMDLRELQGWRRRSMVSQQKVRAVIRHLRMHNSAQSEHRADVGLVLYDFEVINKDIEDAGRRLENMLPVVTSLVQIIDARQSFAETANISRLTVLALIFVPLSYVSSLFSMNTTNMPGSAHFWVYFAVAIPVTLTVVLIARPPTKEGLHHLLVQARTALGRLRRQAAPLEMRERRQSTA